MPVRKSDDLILQVPDNYRGALAEYFNATRVQIFATYQACAEGVSLVNDLDVSFVALTQCFNHLPEQLCASALMYTRAFVTFRIAARSAMAGELYETCVLSRSVLESAVYGFACVRSEKIQRAWRDRALSDHARQNARKVFNWKKLIGLLEDSNQDLGERVNRFYQDLIDLGAHPNSEGVYLSNDVARDSAGESTINTIFAHGEEGVRLAIVQLLVLGGFVLELSQQTFEQLQGIHGINPELENLISKIGTYIRRCESLDTEQTGM